MAKKQERLQPPRAAADQSFSGRVSVSAGEILMMVRDALNLGAPTDPDVASMARRALADAYEEAGDARSAWFMRVFADLSAFLVADVPTERLCDLADQAVANFTHAESPAQRMYLGLDSTGSLVWACYKIHLHAASIIGKMTYHKRNKTIALRGDLTFGLQAGLDHALRPVGFKAVYSGPCVV